MLLYDINLLYMFDKIKKIISSLSKIELSYSFLYVIICSYLYSMISCFIDAESIVSMFIFGGCFLMGLYVICYFTFKLFREKNSFNENTVVNFFIGEIIKKKSRKRYIDWNAVAFLIASFSIFVASVTGILSIKLSSQSLEISRDMVLLNKKSLSIQNLVIRSGVFMDGNIILNSKDVVDGNLLLTSFYDLFYRLMRLSDEELLEISYIMFLESEEKDEYFRIKYGIEDDDLIYVIKFYLSKYRNIALEHNYYSTYVIPAHQLNRMSLYEQKLLVFDLSQAEIEAYTRPFINVFALDCMCKIYIKWINPDKIKEGFPEFFDEYYGACSVISKEAILASCNRTSKLSAQNNSEYLLFKHIHNYLLNNKKYTEEEMMDE